jgi:hypothetical protein
MTTFHIPNAINPKSWTCSEVVNDHVQGHAIHGLNELIQVVAILADRADSQAQIEIVRLLAWNMEVRK